GGRRQTRGRGAAPSSAAGMRGRRRSAYEAPRAAADGGTRLGGAESKRRRRPRLPAPPSRVTLLVWERRHRDLPQAVSIAGSSSNSIRKEGRDATRSAKPRSLGQRFASGAMSTWRRCTKLVTTAISAIERPHRLSTRPRAGFPDNPPPAASPPSPFR